MAKRVLCALILAGALLGILPKAIARNVLHFGRVPAIAAGIDLSAHFKQYRILLLSDSIETLADGEALTLRVEGGATHSFILEDSRLFAPNHAVSIAGPEGVQRKTLAAIGYDGAYFTNNNLAAGNKLVLAQFEGQYSISMAQGSDAWELEPLSAYIEGATKNLYVQYAAKAAKSPKASCGTLGAQVGSPGTELEFAL